MKIYSGHILDAAKILKGNVFRVWVYAIFSPEDWTGEKTCNDLNISLDVYRKAIIKLNELGYMKSIWNDDTNKYSHTEYYINPIETSEGDEN